MSRVLGAIWENIYGLLVDDGQLAVGIVGSLAVVWALRTYAGELIGDAAGWVLLALLLALTLANVRQAGWKARRQIAQKEP
jgi:hypothetical protein